MLTRAAKEGNDARLLFEDDWTDLGREITASFFFLFGEDAAQRYRDAGRFFLKEVRIIAEARII